MCSVSEFIHFYADQEDRTVTPTIDLNLELVTDDTTPTAVTATLSATLNGDTAAQAGIDGLTGGANDADNETDGDSIDSIQEMDDIIDTCS